MFSLYDSHPFVALCFSKSMLKIFSLTIWNIDESGIIILNEKEGSYEGVALYSESLEMQIANTIAAANDELNDDIDEDEDEGMGITFG